MDKESLVQQLCEELGELGIQPTDEQAALLLRHIELVIETNKTMNLTRIVDPADAVTLHCVDSLTLLAPFKESQEKTHLPYLDIGTGAGFPGIPLAIMSGSKGLLIDSTQKKVRAVASFIEDLGLAGRIQAEAVRAEELALTQPRQFGTVVARAVAQLPTLIEYAAPMLCKHGALVVSKGQLTDEEYENSLYAADVCGLVPVSRETAELPHGAGHRVTIVYTKEGSAKIKLPRRAGMAQHHPLVPKNR